MSLAKLVLAKENSILGIDASTRSIAFCLFKDNVPIKWGEVYFDGADVYERILDARNKVREIIKEIPSDFVAIEAAVMVRSASTGLKMAYIFGAIMGELISDGRKVVEVHPITWQSYIGNKNFTNAEKKKVKDAYPDKSANWQKGKIREIRKQKTIDFCKGLGVNVESDNVADACGIAWYAVKNLMRSS
jgi:Holliday junction resolvasome RuvABC endonuclease subunit